MTTFVNVMDLVYPVGSLYMSIAPTSPASIFVGQWSQIKNALIAAAGDVYGIAGQNGGKKSLETKNVPQHTHNTEVGNAAATSFSGWAGFWTTNASSGNIWKLVSYGSSNQTSEWLYATSLTGGASNVAQPYVPYNYCANVWTRTS